MRNIPLYFVGGRVASLARPGARPQCGWKHLDQGENRRHFARSVDRKRSGVDTHQPSLLEGFSLAAPLALGQETVRMHHDPKKASRYENPCMRLEDLIDLTFAFDEPVLSTMSSNACGLEVHVNMLISNQ